jgi:hypothetical protein
MPEWEELAATACAVQNMHIQSTTHPGMCVCVRVRVRVRVRAHVRARSRARVRVRVRVRVCVHGKYRASLLLEFVARCST